MGKRNNRCELVQAILLVLALLIAALLFIAAFVAIGVALTNRYNPPGSVPSVALRDVTVYEFNATSLSSRGPTGPSYLNTSIQITLSSRNPSRRIGISYFMLSTYASYRGQPITPLILMAPDAYQGHEEVIEWSPFLDGKMVPVSPGALAQDLAVGTVPIDVQIGGRMKWRPDYYAKRDGIYPIHVNCPAAAILMLNVMSGAATGSRPSMKVQSVQNCKVDVII